MIRKIVDFKFFICLLVWRVSPPQLVPSFLRVLPALSPLLLPGLIVCSWNLSGIIWISKYVVPILKAIQTSYVTKNGETLRSVCGVLATEFPTCWSSVECVRKFVSINACRPIILFRYILPTAWWLFCAGWWWYTYANAPLKTWSHANEYASYLILNESILLPPSSSFTNNTPFAGGRWWVQV